MDPQIVDLAEQLLQKETDFVVPVKKIWLMLSLMGKIDDVAFESFAMMLRSDQRFEIFEDEDAGVLSCQVDELEDVGFFMGPRVMLKSRKPSRREMGELLLKKTALIYEDLKNVWMQRDRYSEEEQDQLLYALASTQKLLQAIVTEFFECEIEQL